MGGMSGKHKKQVRIAQQVVALTELQQQILQTQLKTEEDNEKDTEKAQELIRQGRREEARKVLMKKQQRQRQLQRSNTQLDKIEMLTENLISMTQTVEEKKVKRSKWRLFVMKHKNRWQNTDSQTKTADLNVEDIEIQKLGCKKKEKQEILASMKEGIQKQRKIDDVLANRLGINCSNEAVEKSVEQELEYILQADYPPPDISQETAQDTIEKAHELKIVAEIAVGA